MTECAPRLPGFDRTEDLWATAHERPDNDRDVVRLVDIDGLSYAEAVPLLDIPAAP